MLTNIKRLTKTWARNRGSKISNGSNLSALTMCGKCYSFYYKKSWHFEKPEDLDDSDNAIVPVSFTQCSACVEQDLSQYEVESGLVMS